MIELLQRLGLGGIALYVAYRAVLWLLTPRPMSTVPHYPIKPGGDMKGALRFVVD